MSQFAGDCESVRARTADACCSSSPPRVVEAAESTNDEHGADSALLSRQKTLSSSQKSISEQKKKSYFSSGRPLNEHELEGSNTQAQQLYFSQSENNERQANNNGPSQRQQPSSSVTTTIEGNKRSLANAARQQLSQFNSNDSTFTLTYHCQQVLNESPTSGSNLNLKRACLRKQTSSQQLDSCGSSDSGQGTNSSGSLVAAGCPLGQLVESIATKATADLHHHFQHRHHLHRRRWRENPDETLAMANDEDDEIDDDVDAREEEEEDDEDEYGDESIVGTPALATTTATSATTSNTTPTGSLNSGPPAATRAGKKQPISSSSAPVSSSSSVSISTSNSTSSSVSSSCCSSAAGHIQSLSCSPNAAELSQQQPQQQLVRHMIDQRALVVVENKEAPGCSTTPTTTTTTASITRQTPPPGNPLSFVVLLETRNGGGGNNNSDYPNNGKTTAASHSNDDEKSNNPAPNQRALDRSGGSSSSWLMSRSLADDLAGGQLEPARPTPSCSSSSSAALATSAGLAGISSQTTGPLEARVAHEHQNQQDVGRTSARPETFASPLRSAASSTTNPHEASSPTKRQRAQHHHHGRRHPWRRTFDQTAAAATPSRNQLAADELNPWQSRNRKSFDLSSSSGSSSPSEGQQMIVGERLAEEPRRHCSGAQTKVNHHHEDHDERPQPSHRRGQDNDPLAPSSRATASISGHGCATKAGQQHENWNGNGKNALEEQPKASSLQAGGRNFTSARGQKRRSAGGAPAASSAGATGRQVCCSPRQAEFADYLDSGRQPASQDSPPLALKNNNNNSLEWRLVPLARDDDDKPEGARTDCCPPSAVASEQRLGSSKQSPAVGQPSGSGRRVPGTSSKQRRAKNFKNLSAFDGNDDEADAQNDGSPVSLDDDDERQTCWSGLSEATEGDDPSGLLNQFAVGGTIARIELIPDGRDDDANAAELATTKRRRQLVICLDLSDDEQERVDSSGILRNIGQHSQANGEYSDDSGQQPQAIVLVYREQLRQPDSRLPSPVQSADYLNENNESDWLLGGPNGFKSRQNSSSSSSSSSSSASIVSSTSDELVLTASSPSSSSQEHEDKPLHRNATKSKAVIAAARRACFWRLVASGTSDSQTSSDDDDQPSGFPKSLPAESTSATTTTTTNPTAVDASDGQLAGSAVPAVAANEDRHADEKHNLHPKIGNETTCGRQVAGEAKVAPAAVDVGPALAAQSGANKRPAANACPLAELIRLSDEDLNNRPKLIQPQTPAACSVLVEQLRQQQSKIVVLNNKQLRPNSANGNFVRLNSIDEEEAGQGVAGRNRSFSSSSSSSSFDENNVDAKKVGEDEDNDDDDDDDDDDDYFYDEELAFNQRGRIPANIQTAGENLDEEEQEEEQEEREEPKPAPQPEATTATANQIFATTESLLAQLSASSGARPLLVWAPSARRVSCPVGQLSSFASWRQLWPIWPPPPSSNSTNNNNAADLSELHLCSNCLAQQQQQQQHSTTSNLENHQDQQQQANNRTLSSPAPNHWPTDNRKSSRTSLACSDYFSSFDQTTSDQLAVGQAQPQAGGDVWRDLAAFEAANRLTSQLAAGSSAYERQQRASCYMRTSTGQHSQRASMRRSRCLGASASSGYSAAVVGGPHCGPSGSLSGALGPLELRRQSTITGFDHHKYQAPRSPSLCLPPPSNIGRAPTLANPPPNAPTCLASNNLNPTANSTTGRLLLSPTHSTGGSSSPSPTSWHQNNPAAIQLAAAVTSNQQRQHFCNQPNANHLRQNQQQQQQQFGWNARSQQFGRNRLESLESERGSSPSWTASTSSLRSSIGGGSSIYSVNHLANLMARKHSTSSICSSVGGPTSSCCSGNSASSNSGRHFKCANSTAANGCGASVLQQLREEAMNNCTSKKQALLFSQQQQQQQQPNAFNPNQHHHQQQSMSNSQSLAATLLQRQQFHQLPASAGINLIQNNNQEQAVYFFLCCCNRSPGSQASNGASNGEPANNNNNQNRNDDDQLEMSRAQAAGLQAGLSADAGGSPRRVSLVARPAIVDSDSIRPQQAGGARLFRNQQETSSPQVLESHRAAASVDTTTTRQPQRTMASDELQVATTTTTTAAAGTSEETNEVPRGNLTTRRKAHDEDEDKLQQQQRQEAANLARQLSLLLEQLDSIQINGRHLEANELQLLDQVRQRILIGNLGGAGATTSADDHGRRPGSSAANKVASTGGAQPVHSDDDEDDGGRAQNNEFCNYDKEQEQRSNATQRTNLMRYSTPNLLLSSNFEHILRQRDRRAEQEKRDSSAISADEPPEATEAWFLSRSPIGGGTGGQQPSGQLNNSNSTSSALDRGSTSRVWVSGSRESIQRIRASIELTGGGGGQGRQSKVHHQQQQQRTQNDAAKTKLEQQQQQQQAKPARRNSSREQHDGDQDNTRLASHEHRQPANLNNVELLVGCQSASSDGRGGGGQAPGEQPLLSSIYQENGGQIDDANARRQPIERLPAGDATQQPDHDDNDFGPSDDQKRIAAAAAANPIRLAGHVPAHRQQPTVMSNQTQQAKQKQDVDGEHDDRPTRRPDGRTATSGEANGAPTRAQPAQVYHDQAGASGQSQFVVGNDQLVKSMAQARYLYSTLTSNVSALLATASSTAASAPTSSSGGPSSATTTTTTTTTVATTTTKPTAGGTSAVTTTTTTISAANNNKSISPTRAHGGVQRKQAQFVVVGSRQRIATSPASRQQLLTSNGRLPHQQPAQDVGPKASDAGEIKVGGRTAAKGRAEGDGDDGSSSDGGEDEPADRRPVPPGRRRSIDDEEAELEGGDRVEEDDDADADDGRLVGPPAAAPSIVESAWEQQRRRSSQTSQRSDSIDSPQLQQQSLLQQQLQPAMDPEMHALWAQGADLDTGNGNFIMATRRRRSVHAIHQVQLHQQHQQLTSSMQMQQQQSLQQQQQQQQHPLPSGLIQKIDAQRRLQATAGATPTSLSSVKSAPGGKLRSELRKLRSSGSIEENWQHDQQRRRLVSDPLASGPSASYRKSEPMVVSEMEELTRSETLESDYDDEDAGPDYEQQPQQQQSQRQDDNYEVAAPTSRRETGSGAPAGQSGNKTSRKPPPADDSQAPQIAGELEIGNKEIDNNNEQALELRQDDDNELRIYYLADAEYNLDELESNASLLANLFQWNFPIFELANSCGQSILSKLSYRIFYDSGFFDSFKIPKQAFFNFFHALEEGYHDKPYHNRLHAADVLHAVYYLTSQPIDNFCQVPLDLIDHYDDLLATTKPSVAAPLDEGELADEHRESDSGGRQLHGAGQNSELIGDRDFVGQLHNHIVAIVVAAAAAAADSEVPFGIMGANLTALEVMALYTAAAMHDFQHPGRTNSFLVATNSPLALLYNDRSVLENHHSAAAWALFYSGPNFNWLCNLEKDEFKRFRFMIIELILATDLMRHYELVSAFNKKLNNVGRHNIDWFCEIDRLLVMEIIIKLADVNGPMKGHQLHCQWTDRIAMEFYEQGDEERALGLPVSLYMDRSDPRLPELQKSFINHLVGPLSHSYAAAGFFPRATTEQLIDDSANQQQQQQQQQPPAIEPVEETHEEATQDREPESVYSQTKYWLIENNSPDGKSSSKLNKQFTTCIQTMNLRNNFLYWDAKSKEKEKEKQKQLQQQRSASMDSNNNQCDVTEE